jgi:hypothetical protein
MPNAPFDLEDHLHVVCQTLDWLADVEAKGGSLADAMGEGASLFDDRAPTPRHILDAIEPARLPFFDHSNTETSNPQEIFACVAMCYPEWQAGMGWGGWEDNLFDGSGLRRALRAKGTADSGKSSCDVLIVALDEEAGYSSLLAYTAYREGYRAFAVSGEAQRKELASNRSIPNGLTVAAFVDVGLRFPDLNVIRDLETLLGGTILSGASQPRLCLATAGAADAFSNDAVNKANQEFIRAGGKDGKVAAVMHKPIGGIYAIRREGLSKLVPDAHRVADRKDDGSVGSRPHSAEGFRQCLAGRLLARSRRLLEQAREPLAALKAAVLSLDARALLRGSTETLQVESVILQHRAEVTAECLFAGVGRDMKARERLGEAIHQLKQAWRVKQAQNRRQRKRAACGSIILLADRLRFLYDSHGHYYSAARCLQVSRDYHRKLTYAYTHPAKYWLGFGWLFNLCQWYYEYLIGHLWVFALAVVVGTSLIYVVMASYPMCWHPSAPTSEFDRVMHAFKAFTTAGMRVEWVRPGWPTVTIAALALLGGVHWAFFISHLYARLARK